MQTEQLNQKIRLVLYNGIIFLFRADQPTASIEADETLKAWGMLA